MTYDTMTHDELIATLHRRDAVIRVLEKDAHDARNQLQAAWAQLEAIGAGGVDRRLHTGVAVPQEAPSMQPKHATQACSMQPIATAFFTERGEVAYTGIYDRTLKALEGVKRTRLGSPVGSVDLYAAPVAAQPQPSGNAGELPPEIEQMAITRYRPVPAGWLVYKVVAGDGTRSLFSGTKDECQIVARKLTEAFLDGAHVASKALAAQPSGQVQQDAVDAAFEAVRKTLCTLPRYSFLLDDDGVIRRSKDRTGNWIEFDDAHALFDPVAVDAARQEQGDSNG